MSGPLRPRTIPERRSGVSCPPRRSRASAANLMSLDPLLLDLLACPIDKQPLLYLAEYDVLYNPRLRRSYQIRDGIPVMLASKGDADRAQDLSVEKAFYESMFAGLKGLEDGHWPMT